MKIRITARAAKTDAGVAHEPKRPLYKRPAREALGFPKAVELLFDATTSRMGIRPVNPKQQNSRLVYSKPDSKHATISVLAFCSRFNIKPEHRTIRFDDVYVDSEGILILDFKTAKNATRPNAKRNAAFESVNTAIKCQIRLGQICLLAGIHMKITSHLGCDSTC